MDNFIIILVSCWAICGVFAWSKKKVDEGVSAVRHLSETALQQQTVISCQETVIADQKKVIIDLRKKTHFPTVKDYHTHIFSTKN